MSPAPNRGLSVAASVSAVVRDPTSVPAADADSLLVSKDAAKFLAISLRLLQSRADIPRVNVSPPGSERPMWRYRRGDLIEFIARSTILPFRREASA